MADFEDNNPFADNDRRLSTSSSATNDFSNLSVNTDDEDKDEHQQPNQYNANSNSARSYSSRVEQILMENPEENITIIDAGKSHEGNSRGFIAYTIRLHDLAVRRRYSEFESLRTTLTRLFPTLIIPPIPEKHTVSDYAAAPTKAKEDTVIIEHRQRMLSVFLNRCAQMAQVRHHPVFHRFLDPNSSWSEVLNTPPVSNLPKNILKAPPLDPASESPAHTYLPIPSSSAKLKGIVSDTTFDEAEQNAKEYEAIIVNGLEKINRRISKRYSDMASDYSELGAKFNGFSLEESNENLANAIEKIGQAVDNTYISTEALVTSLSESFGEPLGESAQFAAVVRQVLKYRRQKAAQKELTSDTLSHKKQSLETLERQEQEAQRINQYLQRDLGEEAQQQTVSSNTVEERTSNEEEPSPTTINDEENDDSESQQTFPPTHAVESSPSKTKKSGVFKIPGFGKLNHAIHGFMDVDPEATRRSNIGKTREQISQLEEAMGAAKQDIQDASSSVKKDLERFQKQKEDDLRKIMRSYIKLHAEWAKKNLESWQEAKAEIEKV